MRNLIFEEVDHYINKLFAFEDDILIDININLEKEYILNASISPNQGKLLQVYARSCHAKHILELGTFVGYSTIWLGRSLPKDGKLISIEQNEGYAKMAKQNIEKADLSNQVDIRHGTALDILSLMIKDKTAPFDLIFIDADKPPYLEYFKLALQLSRRGTIIICDNVVRGGKILNEQSEDVAVKGVQRLNNFVATCDEVTATIFQNVGIKNHDGMLIAVVK